MSRIHRWFKFLGVEDPDEGKIFPDSVLAHVIDDIGMKSDSLHDHDEKMEISHIQSNGDIPGKGSVTQSTVNKSDSSITIQSSESLFGISGIEPTWQSDTQEREQEAIPEVVEVPELETAQSNIGLSQDTVLSGDHLQAKTLQDNLENFQDKQDDFSQESKQAIASEERIIQEKVLDIGQSEISDSYNSVSETNNQQPEVLVGTVEETNTKNNNSQDTIDAQNTRSTIVNEIVMPALGESVTEGTITQWFKKVGDRIEEDEVLFEVSTDKVDSEVPSSASGYLLEIRAQEGDVVEIGDVIAIVGDTPGNGESATNDVTEQAPVAATSAPIPDKTSVVDTKTDQQTQAVAGNEQPINNSVATKPVAGTLPINSPVIRQLVQENSLDVNQISGTGVEGKITRADVEGAIQSGATKNVEDNTVAKEVVRSAPKPRSGTGDTVEPFNNIRRRTAEHMFNSKKISPHALAVIEVDYENVERARRRHQANFEQAEGHGLTYLPFVARAVVDAIRDFPHVNASVGEDALIIHNYVHLAVSVDVNFEGLLAPVIHDADDKRLRAIARETHRLARAARNQELTIEDISGGTFTISNSGSFGTHLVMPIINQPQVGIISVDGISRKPVVITDADGNESIAIHSVGLLALSWDHRAFDGGYAGSFLSEVKHILETRNWEAEL